ncbi:MAG TPA: universal stress protein [Ktedonobacterales bacterium]
MSQNTPISNESLQASVLVALDGSPAAMTAVPVARALADQLQAKLDVLYVVPQGGSHLRMSTWLGTLGDILGTSAVSEIDIHMHVGEPSATILRLASEPDAVLIVLTTHGRHVEPGRVLGHVAEAVVAGTIRPVVLVRPEAACARLPVSPIRRLLLPLDGSPTTATAVQQAIVLASLLGADVDVLYVAGQTSAKELEAGQMGLPAYIDQPQHEWAQWNTEIVERLCRSCAQFPPEMHTRVFLRQGDVASEIVRLAGDEQYDGIVLVRRSHLEFGRARALRIVLQNTPCLIIITGVP